MENLKKNDLIFFVKISQFITLYIFYNFIITLSFQQYDSNYKFIVFSIILFSLGIFWLIIDYLVKKISSENVLLHISDTMYPWIAFLIDWYIVALLVWGLKYNFAPLKIEIIGVTIVYFILYMDFIALVLKKSIGMTLLRLKLGESYNYNRIKLLFNQPIQLIGFIPILLSNFWILFVYCVWWGYIYKKKGYFLLNYRGPLVEKTTTIRKQP